MRTIGARDFTKRRRFDASRLAFELQSDPMIRTGSTSALRKVDGEAVPATSSRNQRCVGPRIETRRMNGCDERRS